MKEITKKSIAVDKKIYEIFREFNLNQEEKQLVVGNLVKDLGYVELGERIKNDL